MASPRLAPDERAVSFTATVVPLFLAVAGLLMIATGAIGSMVLLMLAGAGAVVLGLAVFMIAASVQEGHRRRAEAVRRRKARAKAGFDADRQRAPAPRAPVRSPLADHAVAALTGSAEGGGIYPPLPSQASGKAAAGKPRPNASAPVAMWEPGAAPRPAAFDDGRVVEFTEVRQDEIQAAMVAGGGAELTWDDAPQRASMAPVSDRDFRIWPGTGNVDQWATFTGERKPTQSRASDEDIRTAMVARRKEFAGKLPTVGAILAGVDARNDPATRDMTRGKCSQCESVIWAPKQRPILLKCPSCGHKARLY